MELGFSLFAPAVFQERNECTRDQFLLVPVTLQLRHRSRALCVLNCDIPAFAHKAPLNSAEGFFPA